jgi:hypothetical protein
MQGQTPNLSGQKRKATEDLSVDTSNAGKGKWTKVEHQRFMAATGM